LMVSKARSCPMVPSGFCPAGCEIDSPCGIELHMNVALASVDAGRHEKHSHYFKECPFDSVDVYRVLSLFNVTDPCLQHAVKKLLVAGGRGHKDIAKDVQDSIDTLERWKAMRAEEQSA
jgi:hypothetical protein